MKKQESNAIMIEPKYLARYFVYQDSSRKQAYVRAAVWMDERVLERGFGSRIETQEMTKDAPIEYLTVVNHPVVKMLDDPYQPGIKIPVVDVYYAPTEQWTLYRDATEEEMRITPRLIPFVRPF